MEKELTLNQAIEKIEKEGGHFKGKEGSVELEENED